MKKRLFTQALLLSANHAMRHHLISASKEGIINA